MVKPFAVRCSPAEFMALRVLLRGSSTGRSLVEHHESIIVRIIVKFTGATFDDLDFAVKAACVLKVMEWSKCHRAVFCMSDLPASSAASVS